jgi:hypothetical protein
LEEQESMIRQVKTAVATAENSDAENDEDYEEKPPTPMTLRAMKFFDSLMPS